VGQYLCQPPVIEEKTQQPVGCTRENIAKVTCEVASGVACISDLGVATNTTFQKDIHCDFTSGKQYRTALLLAIFLGWLGVDRFYLGFPAIGLFKLCTSGFMFLFHLVDVILIALQIVGPSDGTGYVVDYYGPRSTPIRLSNTTYINQPYFFKP
jgi:TM2 domain-containing membrane protein YozV